MTAPRHTLPEAFVERERAMRELLDVDPVELLGALHAQHGGRYRRADTVELGAAFRRAGEQVGAAGAASGVLFGAAVRAAAEEQRRAVEATLRAAGAAMRAGQGDYERAD